ncbi:phosphoglycerate mutase family protein [Qipengyuania flava]|uniref:phosphoglycerate mutase family protein n=1 Tax=Qipengyuania flava TaxID=192812 RepID=UPI001C6397AF|nr:phosphoglycerate mutase family protein [Qipengyuania flava]QYJ06968.1 histidine phosphatase family protein [Qipengyuania flava]
MKKRQVLAPLAAFMLGACAPTAGLGSGESAASLQSERTIFVIRHLHKAQGEDPPLSSEGAAAAESLADLLEDKGIVAAFATPTRRAMQTAAPLAERTGITISQYDAFAPEDLVASVEAIDGSVLVVGHSNTVPDLVVRFGGKTQPVLTEQDYGTVFMIDGKGRVDELSVE